MNIFSNFGNAVKANWDSFKKSVIDEVTDTKLLLQPRRGFRHPLKHKPSPQALALWAKIDSVRGAGYRGPANRPPDCLTEQQLMQLEQERINKAIETRNRRNAKRLRDGGMEVYSKPEFNW